MAVMVSIEFDYVFLLWPSTRMFDSHHFEFRIHLAFRIPDWYTRNFDWSSYFAEAQH